MAGRVDDQGGGETENAGGMDDVAVVIQQDGQVGERVFGQEGADGGQARAVGGDGDDGDGAGGGQRVQFGELGDTGDAPGGPEIQHQGLAQVGLQGGGGAGEGLQGKGGERGRRVGGDRGRGVQVVGVGGIAWRQGGQ